MVDDKGRCCGKKPIIYKGGAWNSPERPMKFCSRCCAAYDPNTNEQFENWAWKNIDGVFVRPFKRQTEIGKGE